MTRRERSRLLLPFLPSLIFGVAGAVWVGLAPPTLPEPAGTVQVAVAAAALAASLLAGAWLLERTVPSFRWASRLLESALQRLHLTPLTAVLLAALTAGGEELFFRGGLMQLLGVWGQALLFGALHPVSRRGWAYTLFTVLAGVAFGYATLLTGTLWTAVLAHFAVNLHGLLGTSRRRAGVPLAIGRLSPCYRCAAAPPAHGRTLRGRSRRTMAADGGADGNDFRLVAAQRFGVVDPRDHGNSSGVAGVASVDVQRLSPAPSPANADPPDARRGSGLALPAGEPQSGHHPHPVREGGRRR
ncbi:MAG: CPBP family intramembrane glutamic endopeptidase [Trueperaceae bacterium]